MKKKLAIPAVLAAVILVGAASTQSGFIDQVVNAVDVNKNALPTTEHELLNKISKMGGLKLVMSPAFAQIPLGDTDKLRQEGRDIVEFNLIGRSVDLPLMGGGTFKAMTFSEQVPGPTLRVTQGDVVVMTLTIPENELTPHGNDMHASQMTAVPSFGAVMPGNSLTYAYIAEVPGTFKYHCSGVNIADMDRHVLSGMYGLTIVDPLKGYKKLITEKTATRNGNVVRVHEDYTANALEFQLQYNQLYIDENGNYDVDAMFKHDNTQTVVNGMAFGYTPNEDHAQLIKGDKNKKIFVAEPWRDAAGHLKSQVIWVPTNTHTRWFVENQGNEPVFFHIVGEILDRVYQGNKQQSWGTESWLIGGSQGAIIDVVFDEPGVYVAVNHDYAAIFSGAATVIVAGDPFGLGIDPSEMPNPSDAVPPMAKYSMKQNLVLHGLMTDKRAEEVKAELGI